MTTEERELLVGFYNRNKQLFETMIEAMIQQATNDGDAEAAKDFSVVKEGLKKARGNHYYTVNGEGKYSPYQIIEKYIKFKIDEGTPFNKILRKDDGSAITHIGPSFISTDPEIFAGRFAQVNDLITNHSVPLHDLFRDRIAAD